MTKAFCHFANSYYNDNSISKQLASFRQELLFNSKKNIPNIPNNHINKFSDSKSIPKSGKSEYFYNFKINHTKNKEILNKFRNSLKESGYLVGQLINIHNKINNLDSTYILENNENFISNTVDISNLATRKTFTLDEHNLDEELYFSKYNNYIEKSSIDIEYNYSFDKLSQNNLNISDIKGNLFKNKNISQNFNQSFRSFRIVLNIIKQIISCIYYEKMLVSKIQNTNNYRSSIINSKRPYNPLLSSPILSHENSIISLTSLELDEDYYNDNEEKYILEKNQKYSQLDAEKSKSILYQKCLSQIDLNPLEKQFNYKKSYLKNRNDTNLNTEYNKKLKSVSLRSKRLEDIAQKSQSYKSSTYIVKPNTKNIESSITNLNSHSSYENYNFPQYKKTKNYSSIYVDHVNDDTINKSRVDKNNLLSRYRKSEMNLKCYHSKTTSPTSIDTTYKPHYLIDKSEVLEENKELKKYYQIAKECTVSPEK